MWLVVAIILKLVRDAFAGVGFIEGGLFGRGPNEKGLIKSTGPGVWEAKYVILIYALSNSCLLKI